MVIKLYKTVDDTLKVNKTLTDELSLTCVARDPVNIVSPIIEYEGDNTTIAGYNYAYIEDYARYYFMTVQNDSYNMNTLVLRSDVLRTAKDWLLQRNAIIKRNEALYNAYLNDPDFNTYAYSNIVTKAFPTAVNSDSIILMTVG